MAGCVRRFLPIAGGCRVDDGDIQKPALLVELKIARLERSLARVMQDKHRYNDHERFDLIVFFDSKRSG